MTHTSQTPIPLNPRSQFMTCLYDSLALNPMTSLITDSLTDG
jgi:hypothetical protein